MSNIITIDSLLLRRNLSSIYISNSTLDSLEQDVNKLNSLERGKRDEKNFFKAKELIDYISHHVIKSQKGQLTDVVSATNDLFGPVKSAITTINPEDLNKFKEICAIFSGIFSTHMEFLALFGSKEESSYDSREDNLIRKIPLPLPYEVPTTNELKVIVDRDSTFKLAYSSIETHYVNITDIAGRKWRATGIPLGPRSIFANAEKITILAKKTLDSDGTIIESVGHELPLQVQESILDFIHVGRSKYPHVCFDFIKYIYKNQKPHEYQRFTDEEQLSVGDVISFVSENVGPDVDLIAFERLKRAHHALYLGQNLYLSIYGFIGPLRISTKEAMLQSEHYKDIIVLKYTPK